MPKLLPCLALDRDELGLATEASCWRLVYSGAEIVQATGDATLNSFRLELVGRSIWDDWPHESFSDWWFDVPGKPYPAEVLRARVRLPKSPARLELSWLGSGIETMEIRGMLGATDASVRDLVSGRRLIDGVRKASGRQTGYRKVASHVFEERLREAVSHWTSGGRPVMDISKDYLTTRLEVPRTTFDRALRDLGITLADIQARRWPPRAD